VDGRHTLAVLDVTRPRATPKEVPLHSGDLSPCLWGPGDSELLCDDYRVGERYVVAPATANVAGPLRLKSKDRFALAWEQGGAS